MKNGRISFARVHTTELLDQGSQIPFVFDDRARWKIMSKEVSRHLTCRTSSARRSAGVAHYLPADGITIADAGATVLEAARKEAQDAFADA
ncbi:hypothetical protein [Burkholderia sola]|uniref:hypothetical protein n=1 Tax=Burkholderia sola TaxID=2843302 RepID=UPI00338FFD9C